MAKSIIFPTAVDLSQDEHDRLTDAYETACDELVGNHGWSPELLAKAVEPMAAAILKLYRAGQRDKEQLSLYAASQGLAALNQGTRSQT